MGDLVRFLSLFAAFLAVAGLLLALGVFRDCSRSASEASIAKEIRDIPPSFNMTANQLVQTYKTDEQSAVATYNGSVGIVKGRAFLVHEFNYLFFDGDASWSVRCFLSDEEMAKLRGPREDYYEFYMLKGKVEGVNDKHLTIDLRGCTLHDSP